MGNLASVLKVLDDYSDLGRDIKFPLHFPQSLFFEPGQDEWRVFVLAGLPSVEEEC